LHAERRRDRQTDMTKLTVSTRFANAPKSGRKKKQMYIPMYQPVNFCVLFSFFF